MLPAFKAENKMTVNMQTFILDLDLPAVHGDHKGIVSEGHDVSLSKYLLNLRQKNVMNVRSILTKRKMQEAYEAISCEYKNNKCDKWPKSL